jgi:hypothetical protein
MDRAYNRPRHFLDEPAGACYRFSELTETRLGPLIAPVLSAKRGGARDSREMKMGVKSLKTNNSAKGAISRP